MPCLGYETQWVNAVWGNYGNFLRSIQNTEIHPRPNVEFLRVKTGGTYSNRWCQWPCCLIRRSAASRLLGLRVRIPSGTWMYVCCECCVLSCSGLCVGLITCPQDLYWVWCVLSMIMKPGWLRGPGSIGAVAPWGEKKT